MFSYKRNVYTLMCAVMNEEENMFRRIFEFVRMKTSFSFSIIHSIFSYTKIVYERIIRWQARMPNNKEVSRSFNVILVPTNLKILQRW